MLNLHDRHLNDEEKLRTQLFIPKGFELGKTELAECPYFTQTLVNNITRIISAEVFQCVSFILPHNKKNNTGTTEWNLHKEILVRGKEVE